MSKLDEILSKKPQVTPTKADLRQRLNKSAFLNENTGALPWIVNAVNSVNRGLTQVAETPYNITNRAPQLVNLLPGEQGVGTIDEMAKGTPLAKLFPSKDPLIDLAAEHYPGMGGVGGIKESNPNYPRTSQFMEDFGLGIGSMGATGLATALPGVAGKFAAFLNAPVKAAPIKAAVGEVAAAAGAASGREVADRADLGPVGRTAAEFVGSLSPGVLAYTGPAAAAKLFGREGGSEALAAMERQGVRPSVGMTGGRMASQLESGASALPFFSAVPENVRTRQFDEFSDALTGAAEKMRPVGSGPKRGIEMAEHTRDIVEGGAKKMRGSFGGREDALMQAIGPTTPVDTKNLRAALADQMQRGDAKIQRALQKELEDLDAISDAATGAVPYENLRKWRSNFGSELENQGVVSGAKKQIYAGVTKDTEAVAQAVGKGDEFRSLMKDQSKAYDDTLSLSEGGDLVQADITLAGGQSEKAGNLLRQAYKNPDRMEYLRRNATPEQWNQMRADIAADLGLAKAGAQDATGEIVSPNKFLTEWNAMDPRVKNMLFDDNLGTRQTLDDLALIADAFKQRGLEANTSRTAGTGMSAMGIKDVGKVAMGAGGYAIGLPKALLASGITYATVKGLMSKTLAKWAGGQTPSIQATVAARVPGAVARTLTEENE